MTIKDFEAFRQFMVRHELDLDDDSAVIYRFELPPTGFQRLLSVATEITLTVYPLNMDVFEAMYRDWQEAHDFHDEQAGSRAWRRKIGINHAFSAASYLNPELLAALLPKMTKREATIIVAIMKEMQERVNRDDDE